MKYMIVVLSIFVASCSSTYNKGVDYLNAGDNQSALNYFSSCASEGDSDCYNALGVMFENRRIHSSNPTSDAARYYTMSARYGNTTAQSNLIRLGYGIPPADLKRIPSPEEQRMMMEAAGNLGRAIGGAIR